MDAPGTRNAAVVRRFIVPATIVVLAAGIATGAAAASPARPHIVAKPNNLMVNANTSLTGTGFPAKTKLTIEECATANWVVTSRPCKGAYKISVRTDAHGRFSAKFRALLCGGKRGSGPTSQICYIGNPHPQGVDTITLLGAAKITVTYP